MKKSTKIVLGSIAGIVFIGGCGAAMGDGDTEAKPNDRAAVQPSDEPKDEAPKKESPKAEVQKTQAEEFVACVNKAGTPGEKDAAKHVTKVTGADKTNDILDSAEIFTDYAGSMMTGDSNKGKLLASAFASCYKSENGLVTVYNKDGELLSNGNF